MHASVHVTQHTGEVRGQSSCESWPSTLFEKKGLLSAAAYSRLHSQHNARDSRILLFLPFILQELQTWLLCGFWDLNSGPPVIWHLPSLASHLPKVIDSFVSYNVCALSYRLNKPFMDYGDTVTHGLEASPNAWLQNHAHWGRYLVLPLFTMG